MLLALYVRLRSYSVRLACATAILSVLMRKKEKTLQWAETINTLVYGKLSIHTYYSELS